MKLLLVALWMVSSPLYAFIEAEISLPLEWLQADQANKVMYEGDERGRNKLHIAAICGFTDVIKRNLNIEEANAKDKKGYTPLIWACRKGDGEIVKLLLPRSKVHYDVGRDREVCAAQVACSHKQSACLELILQTKHCCDKKSLFLIAVHNRDSECLSVIKKYMKVPTGVVRSLARLYGQKPPARLAFALEHLTREEKAIRFHVKDTKEVMIAPTSYLWQSTEYLNGLTEEDYHQFSFAQIVFLLAFADPVTDVGGLEIAEEEAEDVAQFAEEQGMLDLKAKITLVHHPKDTAAVLHRRAILTANRLVVLDQSRSKEEWRAYFAEKGWNYYFAEEDR